MLFILKIFLYFQYEGDDEDVDIEEIDGEMGCGDGNSEVDIMKD